MDIASGMYGPGMFPPEPDFERASSTNEPPTPSDPTPDFVVIDVETACSNVSSICQIGIVGFRDNAVLFEYETLVDPRDRFSSFNTRIHGIEAHHVAGQPCYGDVHDTVDAHLSGRTTVARSYFDKGALAAACRTHGRSMVRTTWATASVSRSGPGRSSAATG